MNGDCLTAMLPSRINDHRLNSAPLGAFVPEQGLLAKFRKPLVSIYSDTPCHHSIKTVVSSWMSSPRMRMIINNPVVCTLRARMG